MKPIITAMLEEIYQQACELAQKQSQLIHQDGPDNLRGNFFITINQLEALLKQYEE